MNNKSLIKTFISLWNWINRPFFNELSLSAKLHPFAYFKCKRRISIGANTLISAHSRLIVDKPNSFIKIGANSYIFPYAFLMTYGGFISIGDNCSVNPFCILYGHGGLTIGNGVRIAAGTVIIPANHGYSDINIPIFQQPLNTHGISVGDNVWVGANVSILDGVKISHDAIIAAGAVVTQDVEPYHIVGGVPARLIKVRE